MISVIKQLLRRFLSQLFHCCEKCGNSAASKVSLREAGTLIFKSSYICQSCQCHFGKISINSEVSLNKHEANCNPNKRLSSRRKKA